MFRESQLLSSQLKFIQNIIEKKHLFVDVDFNTKTSLNINLYLSPFRYGINHEVGGMKYLINEEYNFLSGERERKCHLKISKTQRMEAIQKHVELVINKYLPQLAANLDELELRYFETRAIKELAALSEA